MKPSNVNFVRFLSASGSLTSTTRSSSGRRAPRLTDLSQVPNLFAMAVGKDLQSSQKSPAPRRTSGIRGDIFGGEVTPTVENQKRLRALGGGWRRLLRTNSAAKFLGLVGVRQARP